ncbi:hypothetical protein [uncultured Selenomonas sp.]|nr:hypothetical protein [uncultured Selenomonas sp.]
METEAAGATSTQASVPAAEAKAVAAPIEEVTGLAETYGNLAHFFRQRA